ncbi:hypothetical protein [Thiomicrospira pelophila]|uniref:hypothetical protein n=1 Tax=Thiomicrospira pelophila TaxID=934 RepID=UPI0004A773DB|nr:hypothetical protein [Thiomicrospira pelophila]
MSIEKLQEKILQAFKEQGLKNTLSIAEKHGMVQSTVYRNLKMTQVSITPSLKKLCNYAKVELPEHSGVNPRSSKIIMDAIQEVWDGSDAHAKKIRRLLLVAHSCKMYLK